VKGVLLALYRAVSGFLHKSKIVNRIVCTQHQYAPVPIGIYTRFFSNRLMSILFTWYGHHVYHFGYNKRKSDQEYWASDESLYYYGISQAQHREVEIQAILNRIDVSKFLQNKESVIVDLGCGTMKDIRKLIYDGVVLSNNVYGIDFNEVLTKYFDLIGGLPKGVSLRFGNMQEELVKIPSIDVAFILGGTLEYMPRDDVTGVFSGLREKGVKVIIVIGEGTEKDDYKHETGVWIYNLKKIVADSGFGNNWNDVFETKDDGVLAYWACYDGNTIHQVN
jgi:SAM-dependent methyltransferase